MSQPETIVIVNERAGAGAMADAFRRIERPLERVVGAFDVAFTDHPGHAIELTREALDDGYRRVLVGGGDGTINEVVNGWFDAEGAPRAPDARMGLIPGGTGGDLRKTLGVQTQRDALRVLEADRVRPVDVGRLTYRTAHGTDAVRCFLNIASFGLSGEADRFVPSFKQLGGKLAYVGATLRALWTWRNPRVRLVVDDELVVDGPICTVAVANGRYFGGGMMVAPGAEVDDGAFDVVVLGDLSRVELLLQTRNIYDGSHLVHPRVEAHRGQRVSAEADGVVYMDVDGEAIGQLPARFEVLPAALPLVR